MSDSPFVVQSEVELGWGCFHAASRFDVKVDRKSNQPLPLCRMQSQKGWHYCTCNVFQRLGPVPMQFSPTRRYFSVNSLLRRQADAAFIAYRQDEDPELVLSSLPKLNNGRLVPVAVVFRTKREMGGLDDAFLAHNLT